MLRICLNGLKGLLRGFGHVLAVIIILFEEWGWEPLKRMMLWLMRSPILRNIGIWLTRLPPYGALASLAIPFVIDQLIKIIGLVWMLHGHPKLGISIIVAAKVFGTALFAWIFQLAQPQLLQIPWFAWLYARWVPWKDRLIASVKNSRVWRVASRLKQWCKDKTRAFKTEIFRWLHPHDKP